MNRTEIKKLFESLDQHVIEISQIVNFLEVICNEETIEDTGKYLYIIINLLKKECDKLDIEKFQLQEICLDLY